MGGRVTPCLVVLSTFSLPNFVPPCGHHNSFYTIFLPTPKPLSAGRHQKFPQLHLCWVWKKEGTCETVESLLCCCFLCLAYTLDIHIIYTLRYMYITRTSDLRFLLGVAKRLMHIHTHFHRTVFVFFHVGGVANKNFYFCAKAWKMQKRKHG